MPLLLRVPLLVMLIVRLKFLPEPLLELQLTILLLWILIIPQEVMSFFILMMVFLIILLLIL